MLKQVLVLMLLFVMFLSSCKLPGSQPDTIDDSRQIAPETMENILYEMHLADAIVAMQMVKIDNQKQITQYQADSLIYESIYNKYNCSGEALEESILWYLQNDSKTLQNIYENVVERYNKALTNDQQEPEKKENTL